MRLTSFYASALDPSSPQWGQLLLVKGRLQDAATHFARSAELGPYFADPLKYWGDVLVKQGHLREAHAKYEQALKYAPNWAALKDARNAVAQRTP